MEGPHKRISRGIRQVRPYFVLKHAACRIEEKKAKRALDLYIAWLAVSDLSGEII